jgi:phytoene dehydrogenase-like protein
VTRVALTSLGAAKGLISLRKLSGAERAVLAFLIAPSVPALMLTLPAAFQEESIALAQFLAFAAVSYGATLLVALPSHLLLRKWHWTFLSVYVAVGAAMGLAVFVFLFVSGMPSRIPGLGSVVRRLLSLPVDMVGGVIVLICFWLIARPDRE